MMDNNESVERQTGKAFEEYVDVIAALRAPDGCPWDREQTHESIARNMLEEAHEAVQAIESGDTEELVEELGDVLLEVVLQSQIAKDNGEFTIDDVIESTRAKMIRRHPHVFGNEASFEAAKLTEEEVAQIQSIETGEDVKRIWDYIKLKEKRDKAERKQRLVDQLGEKYYEDSLLDSVSKNLPALMQCQDISRKAVACGFEWDTVDDVWAKFDEEVEEFKDEIEKGDLEAAEIEFGDVLFTLVNVARKHGIDAESALRKSCSKFRVRWQAMESFAAIDERDIKTCGFDALELYWQRAKLSD